MIWKTSSHSLSLGFSTHWLDRTYPRLCYISGSLRSLGSATPWPTWVPSPSQAEVCPGWLGCSPQCLWSTGLSALCCCFRCWLLHCWHRPALFFGTIKLVLLTGVCKWIILHVCTKKLYLSQVYVYNLVASSLCWPECIFYTCKCYAMLLCKGKEH